MSRLGCQIGDRFGRMPAVSLLAGPFVAAAVLLAVAGVPKLFRPASTAGAVASLRLPSSALLVRLLGAVELVLAGSALLTGSAYAAVGIAVAYAGFAGFVGLALARPQTLGSCGCFGRPDTPPTPAHLVVNLAAASVAVAVAVTGGVRLDLAGQPLLGLPFLGLTAVVAWFGYLSLALLPRVSAEAYRS